MSWLTDIFRWLFFQIDNIVYGLISILYELLMYLANLDLFGISSMYTGSGFVMDDNNLIFKFASRIYVFLGVIMLFQIAFAILQYMVNPDAFSDKGKGFGKLVTNCLVSLVLIVTVPFIFAFAYNIQSKILSSNVIGKIVLGNSVGDSTSINAANKTMSVDMQFLVFGTFASIDDDVFYGICKDGPVLGTKAMVQATGTYDPNNDYGEKEENASCLDRVQKELMMDGDEERSNIGYFFRTDDKDGRDFSKYSDIINVKDSQGTYIIDYMFIISTIVGVVVVLLLISSCIEVAVRAIKLAFLEIIAPIPIVSYMDPRKSYSDSMLHKWIKECLSTFASLFIRLAIIYFVFFMVDAITSTILATNTSATYANGDVPSGWMAILVQVMIIIGLLIFANQIPKLIEGITGIKASGNFSLNPLKTITQSPIAAGVLGGVAGAGIGAVASGIASSRASIDNGESRLRALGRGFGGALGGLGRGTVAGIGGKKVVSKALDTAGIAARHTMLKGNTKFRYRIGDTARNMIGAQSLKESMDRRIGVYDSISGHVGNMEDRAKSSLAAKSNEWKNIQAHREQIQQQFEAQIKAPLMATRDGKKVEITSDDKDYAALKAQRDTEARNQYVNELNNLYNQEQGLIAEYVNNGGLTVKDENGNVTEVIADQNIAIEKEALKREISENNLQDDYKIDNWDEMQKTQKAAVSKSIELKNSDSYQDASAVDQARKSGQMQGFMDRHS